MNIKEIMQMHNSHWNGMKPVPEKAPADKQAKAAETVKQMQQKK